MAKFPIQYSQTVPGVTQMPQAQTGAGEVWRQVAQAGQVLSGIGEDRLRQKQKMDAEAYDNQVYAEIQNGKIALAEYDSQTALMLRDMTDPSEIDRVGAERLSKRADVIGNIAKLSESKQVLDFYNRQTAVGQFEAIEGRRYDQTKKNAYISFDGLFSKATQDGNFDILEPLAFQAFQKNVITEKEYRSYVETGDKARQKAQVEGIRKLSQDSVGPDYDKTAGYKIIDQAEKEGLITAYDRKALGDSLDNFVSGRKQSEQKQKYTRDLKVYTDFADAISNGELTHEMIGNSGLDKKEQEVWGDYLKNSFKEPPVRSDHKSYLSMMRTVVEFSRKQISEKEAYQELLKARYDGQLSQNDFVFGVNKIREPYPDHIIPDLQATLKSNEEDFHGWWESSNDQHNAQEVNMALMAWVDKMIADGKPVTARDMTAKSDVLRFTTKKMKRVSSPDEFSALAPGTDFIAPDGSIRRKR